MLQVPTFLGEPKEIIHSDGLPINNFEISNGNIDQKTVDSFGEEWEKFNHFDEAEIKQIGDDYFDILPPSLRNKDIAALDVGCGSGRWAAYLSPFVGHIDCVDPSSAVYTASKLLKKFGNIRLSKVDVDNLPFQNEGFDLVYSLGVLHHIPNTFEALSKCVEKVKPGGYFLVYLYYNLENRGLLFRSIFQLSSVFRKLISSAPGRIKKPICDLIAAFVYLPLAKTALAVEYAGSRSLAQKIPLSYYRDKSFWVMKNDALDRFGTPLEQRFTKDQIKEMMSKAGLINITFSDKEPYWHAIGQKP